MIPTGSKLWFGLSAFAAAACIAYFAASGGEQYGAMVLAALVLASFTLGLLSSLLGDADVPAAAATAAGAAPMDAATSQPTAIWPAVAALGAGVAVVGQATGGLLLWLGIGLLVAAGLEWMIQAWAERATDDPVHNRTLRNRLMHPIEIPVVAAVLVGLIIIAFSRVLLALPKVGSTTITIVIAAAILAIAFVLTARPNLSSSLLTGVVVVGSVALLGGGIVGAVVGEREFEHHGDEAHAEDAVTLVITASNVNAFDESEYTVPVGEPVTIELVNDQLGVQHNVNILDLEGAAPSDITTGPETLTFEVTFPEAGDYEFVNDVHPEMTGVIRAVEQPASDDESAAGEG